jgi:hypothetical protein
MATLTGDSGRVRAVAYALAHHLQEAEPVLTE